MRLVMPLLLSAVGLDLTMRRRVTCLQTLAAFLLYELAKGPASRWAPYLRQLPPTYTTFFTWSAHDIAALQVGFCTQELHMRMQLCDRAAGLLICSATVLKVCDDKLTQHRPHVSRRWNMRCRTPLAAARRCTRSGSPCGHCSKPWVRPPRHRRHIGMTHRPSLPVPLWACRSFTADGLALNTISTLSSSNLIVAVAGLEKRWTGVGAWQWAASSLTSRTMHVPFDEAGQAQAGTEDPGSTVTNCTRCLTRSQHGAPAAASVRDEHG